MHYSAIRRYRGFIIVFALIGGCVTTEYIARSRVVPTGRVSNLDEYLRWQPARDQFVEIQINGSPNVIAYGASGSWLLLPSGPSAYVFDESGRLVDWSPDIGDDRKFEERWNAQRSRSAGRSLSRSEVEQFPFHRLAG